MLEIVGFDEEPLKDIDSMTTGCYYHIKNVQITLVDDEYTGTLSGSGHWVNQLNGNKDDNEALVQLKA